MRHTGAFYHAKPVSVQLVARIAKEIDTTGKALQPTPRLSYPSPVNAECHATKLQNDAPESFHSRRGCLQKAAFPVYFGYNTFAQILRMRYLIFAVFLNTCGALQAQHTFSICAVDPLTGEVGSAGASCVSNAVVISDVHPGAGVIHTQGYYVPGNQLYASGLMDEGLSPENIIDSLVAHDLFGLPQYRQYGIVSLAEGGSAAAYTGDSCLDYKGQITGPDYAIQGNILLGAGILEAMENNFVNTDGSLACRLMSALQGAKAPGADSRCAGAGISALSAFLRVARATDTTTLFLDLRVSNVDSSAEDPVDPIDSLQSMFDALGGCSYTDIPPHASPEAPSIYPQPAHGTVFFALHGAFSSLEIFDISGRRISESALTGSESYVLDCSGWDAGIYFYTLITQSGDIISGKIIMQ